LPEGQATARDGQIDPQWRALRPAHIVSGWGEIMRKLVVVTAAALALAGTQVAAQGGGGGAGGSGAGSGQGSAGAGTSAGGGAVSGSEQDRAEQKAPSVTGTEGAGGKRPQPQAQGQGDERRYGEAPSQRSGPEGRPATQTPAQATEAQGQAAKAPGQPSEVSGRVALVNAADGEIGIDAGTTTTQIKVAPDAQITVDGKRSALKDIHQGAQVRASLERGEDGLQAKRIEVTSTAKAAPAKK
jgi:hypothetical protein